MERGGGFRVGVTVGDYAGLGGDSEWSEAVAFGSGEQDPIVGYRRYGFRGGRMMAGDWNTIDRSNRCKV